MLFKLKIKVVSKVLVLIVLNSLMIEVLAAQEINHNLQIHGFIAQGIIDVEGSDFVNDSGDVSTELTEIGLNASYQLSSQFRITGQVVYLEGGNRYDNGTRIDYALLDWSVFQNENWQINLYLGRFKNYHWLYSGTRDVPFTRPSIILPQSMYFDGFRDIAVGGDGGDLKISHSSDNLGDFDFNLSSGTTNISKEQTKLLLSELALGRMKQLSDVQTSLYWQPAFSFWRFGISFLDSDFEYASAEEGDNFLDAEIKLQRSIINAMYEGEKWEFAFEAFQERFILNGFYFDGYHQDKLGLGYYAQSQYKVDKNFTLLLRYEKFYSDKNDKSGKTLEGNTGGLVPSYFAYQHDITLGISYDIAETFRLQLEFHNFTGTARLTPVVLPNLELNDSEHWHLWALQFMYWF